MRRRHARPTCVVLLLSSALLASLPAAAQSGSPVATSSLPSVTLPSSLDRVLRDYESAWRNRDAAALAALFTEDGFVLQGGRPPVHGREAITAAYTGSGGGTLRLRALAFATADSIGYIIGAYGYDAARPDVGKFTLTLRRNAAGRWLIASDMDNGNGTPAGSPDL